MRTRTITIHRDHHRSILIGSLITIFVLIATILNPVFAQTQIGFRGGLSITEPGLNTGLGSTNGLTKAFTGIDLALVSEFQLANRLSLQPEIAYAEKGIRIGTSTDINLFGAPLPIGVETITKVRLLEMPMLAKYQISTGPVSVYANLGPVLSYALNGNFKTRGSLLLDLNLVNENFGLGTQNRLGLGLAGGLGLEVDQGHGTFFIDARYSHQSLKINNLPLADFNINNNGIGFNLGYKFNI